MPKREVTSAPWVPVPARACTGKAPRARQHRAVGRLSAGAPRLHKSCRLRRPQSKGRSCRSGRARRDPRARGGRRHLRERPGWPSGSPISRGSTVSMIAFGGRRGPHRSGSRCRGRPIERREAGREGCLWPNAASQGRPPDGSGGESERSTQNGRAKTLCGGGGGGGAHTNSELPQAGFPESGEVRMCVSLILLSRSLVSTHRDLRARYIISALVAHGRVLEPFIERTYRDLPYYTARAILPLARRARLSAAAHGALPLPSRAARPHRARSSQIAYDARAGRPNVTRL